MKYKDKYQCVRHLSYSIGRFYNSDLRKIASLANYYPFLFPDCVSYDPTKFLTELCRNDNSLFFAVRNGTKVEGYGAVIMLDKSKMIQLDMFRRHIPFSFTSVRAFAQAQLEFLFEHIGTRKIYVRIPAPRVGVVSLARRMGFQIEGILRKDSVFDGKTYDTVVLGMLRKEF